MLTQTMRITTGDGDVHVDRAAFMKGELAIVTDGLGVCACGHDLEIEAQPCFAGCTGHRFAVVCMVCGRHYVATHSEQSS